jgi:hypothetical protein
MSDEEKQEGGYENPKQCKWMLFGKHTLTPENDTTPKIIMGPDLDPNIRRLAAVAYGEAWHNTPPDKRFEEMAAIANVIVRQVKDRPKGFVLIDPDKPGKKKKIPIFYKDVNEFIDNERDFAYAAYDDENRYHILMGAGIDKIMRDKTMWEAVLAARNALCGTKDYSNGAYFWDGVDLKTNTKNPRYTSGFYFTDPSHDKFKLGNRRTPGAPIPKYWDKNYTKLRGEYSYIYESTALIGGTTFWKLTDEFLKATGNPKYK